MTTIGTELLELAALNLHRANPSPENLPLYREHELVATKAISQLNDILRHTHYSSEEHRSADSAADAWSKIQNGWLDLILEVDPQYAE